MRNVDGNYEDQIDDEELDRMLQRSKRLGMSLLSNEGLRRRPLHLGAEDYEESNDEEKEEIKLIKESGKDELLEDPKPVSNLFSIVTISTVVFIIIAVISPIAIYFLYKDMPSFEPALVDQYKKDIAQYRRQFPSQSNELWGNVFSGIQLTSTSNRLSVFLIIHDATTNTSCLAQALGRVSAKLLSNSSHPLIVAASELDPSKMFRQELSTRRAIVVEELQKMPAGEDQKLLLYGLADTENPIVPGIAVVFTLQVNEISTKSALRAAELELERAWDWIDSESRFPLIVRVTSGFVYKMASEKLVTNC